MPSKNAPQVDAAARGSAFGAALRAVRGALAFVGGAASSVHARLRCVSLGRLGNAVRDGVGTEDVSTDRIASVRVRPVAIANALARAVALGGITRRAFSFLAILIFGFVMPAAQADIDEDPPSGDDVQTLASTGTSDPPGLIIVSQTKLHSADYIWSETNKKVTELDQFLGQKVQVKAGFPNDLARTRIGIGEFIYLKLKGKPAALGDIKKAEWRILEGSSWVDIVGAKKGEVITLGAKVLDGPLSRTVKVRVMTTVRKTATFEFKVLKPNGEIKSRHAGKPPANTEIPGVKEDQYDDIHTPKSQEPGKVRVPATGIGAWTVLVMIPMPSSVNFGGKYQDGLWRKERDISSPPKSGTYKPEKDPREPKKLSLFSEFHHTPNPEETRIWESSASLDRIWYYNEGNSKLSGTHTCDWTCEWSWRGKKMNSRVPFRRVVQKFKASSTGVGAAWVTTVTVSKFNNSVTRSQSGLTGATQTRDVENNWKP
jgi:hypothetical protein